MESRSKPFPQAQPEVFALQSSEIAANWPWIEPFLLRVEGADWKPEDVEEALESAQAQLWAAIEGDEILGILITKLEVVGSRKRGLLWIASGSPLEVGLEMYRRFVEPWFKGKGCDYSQIIGRKGWKRVLREYEEVGVILEKRL